MDFDYRRQILFAFKECLANVVKHSGAGCVHCLIGGGVKRFKFEVCDDGEGFSLEEAGRGHGLKNLRNRAEILDGSVTIVSQPGEGTRVIFDTPVRIERN